MGPCWPLARFRNDPQTPIWSQKVGVYETKGVLQMLAIILSAATLLPASDTYSLDQVLEAVRQVETGGLPDQGRGARGDGGLALGPWQIHRAFFIDAAERDKSLNIYSRCLGELDYSRRVVKAYWRRYSRAKKADLITDGNRTRQSMRCRIKSLKWKMVSPVSLLPLAWPRSVP